MTAIYSASKKSALPWLMMLWIACFLFLKYALQFLPGIGIDNLLASFGDSAHLVGYLAAAYFYTYLIFQVPAGVIADRCALSRVMLFALLCCLLGAWLFYAFQSFSVMFLARALMGTGSAFATVAYMRAAAVYFDEKWFGRFAGFFGMICMASAGSSVLLLGWYKDAYGWSSLLFSVFLCASVLACLALYFIKKENARPVEPSCEQVFEMRSILKIILSIITQKNNILLLLYNGLAFAPIAVFGGLWGSNYFIHIHHLSSAQAHVVVSVLFYSYALGGPIVCALFNTPVRQKYLMVGGIFIAMLILWAVVHLPEGILNYCSLMIAMACVGFFASGFLASYSLAKALNATAIVATVIAIVNMGDPIFGGIAEPLIGYVLDAHHGLTRAAYQAGLNVLFFYWIAACVSGLLLNVKHLERS